MRPDSSRLSNTLFGAPATAIDTHRQLKLTRPRGEEFTIVTTLHVPKTGGMNTTKVGVVRWLKREGERINRGEPVVELETEKVNYELDCPVEGVLLKIVAREGAEVPVGDPLCHVGQPGEVAP